VFVLAAALAGAAGWLQAHYLRIVNPGPFHLNASVEYLFMTIIGGVGSLLGAIVGATAVTVAKSWLQTSVPALLGPGLNLEGVVFGLLVLGILQAAPRGITALLPASFGLRPRGSRRSEERLALRAKPAATQSVLAIQSVSKSFHGAQALDRVSLELNAGEIVALVGPNGAGKSTLFNAISGLTPASGGKIALWGEDVTRLPARAIARRGLARTFQHAHLRPEMTVIENVSLGAHTRTSQGVAAALLGRDRPEEASIFGEALACLVELGIGESADARTGTLSLGSQRLVEVARAVACDPIALLLDEPAAGLRAEEKQHLASAILAMRDRGIAILVVEHDLDFVADVADRVVVLDFGTVIAQGTPDEIVRDPRVIEAYLGQKEVSGDVARPLSH
jgi:branched-chain amino acid transport system permease protein